MRVEKAMAIKEGWMMRGFVGAVASIALSGAWFPSPSTADELAEMLDRVMAYEIRPSPGFRSEVVVPTGHFYDPLVMHPHEGVVWINDDGKEEADKGSRLLAVDERGSVSVLVDADRLLPISAGFDVAPDGFGEFGGQIFALSQPEVGDGGGLKNYVVQRIDPKDDFSVSLFCALPERGDGKVAGIGVDARFGPAGSPFEGKLYASSSLNETIYQITPDGTCAPFVRFDPQTQGSPLYLRFAPDGRALLVGVVRGGIFNARGSAILRVSAAGQVDERAVAEAPTMIGSFDFAPEGFGTYGGQLFVTEVGHYEIPVPLGQALRPDGIVHRVTAAGKLEPVARGFINPWNLRFVGDKLWVADINGDFIYGKRELPDGFIIGLSAE